MTDTTNGKRFSFMVPVRLYGPNVIKPVTPDYGNGRKGNPEYSTRFFFPPDHPEAKAFSAALRELSVQQFGEGASGVAYPFQMGDKFADAWIKKHAKDVAAGKKNPRDFARGQVMVKASSKNFPPLLSYANGDIVVDIPDESRQAAGGKFYSGVMALVEVNLVPYEGNGSNIPDCVKAYLTQVCSLNRGERMGGKTGSQTFGSAVRNLGAVSDVDPTAGDDLDDEIPF